MKCPPPKTEACAMQAYLEKLGVDKKHLLLEEKSHDLITSIYQTKKLYLQPRKYKNLLVIASDFQQERVEYVFNKLLGKEYNINFRFIPSRLPAETLWEFFLYEQKALTRTRTLFKLLKQKGISLSSHRLLQTSFYQKRAAGFVKELVFQRKIVQPRTSKRHYSLAKIYKKRLEIFTKYKLDVQKIKTLKADFWSGGFLSFSGRDEKGAYYCLKFVLYQRDKKVFIREMKVIDSLKKKGVSFIPEVVAKNTNHAPLWYLYKVVAGKMAGMYSITYSFEDYFFRDFSIKNLVGNLQTLRSLKPAGVSLPTWGSRMYKKGFNFFSDRIGNFNELKNSKTLGKAKKIYLDHADKFNKITKTYLAHGDLHPGNIIISIKNRKIYLIDFASASYNNIAFDFCFVYLLSWKNKNFQKQLLNTYLTSLNKKQKDEFFLIFDLDYIYVLFWFLEHVYKWRKRSLEESFKQARNFALGELKRIVRRLEKK